jgi:hypothetical protein
LKAANYLATEQQIFNLSAIALGGQGTSKDIKKYQADLTKYMEQLNGAEDTGDKIHDRGLPTGNSIDAGGGFSI